MSLYNIGRRGTGSLNVPSLSGYSSYVTEARKSTYNARGKTPTPGTTQQQSNSSTFTSQVESSRSQRELCARDIVSTSDSGQCSTLVESGRKKVERREIKKRDWAVGMIIRAPLHQEDYNEGASLASGRSNVTQSNTDISTTKYGVCVHTKERIHIVVALFDHHYLAIPLYTHNGNGFEEKDNQAEFVYVHDKLRCTKQPFKEKPPKNPHGSLNALLNSDMNIPTYHRLSGAHITRLVSRSYDLKVKYEGKLATESTKKLLDLCKTKILN
ncbi:hypothetical protein MMC28_002621 [Mycoblastus sanguinarius]|nr:hypothetical protein [Mycoblastus sanguinarius]